MKFADRIRRLLGMEAIQETDWDDLADLLVEGDLGAAFAESIVTELKAYCSRNGIHDGEGARKALKPLLAAYARSMVIEPASQGLDIILLLGVNGVGKTTTAAKLASLWDTRGGNGKDAGKDHDKGGSGIILAAGDTFRAAAIEQLKLHGERLGLRVVAQERGSDPGAVLFDALEAARSDGARLVIADTAGRMHNKQNLMKELEKMDKIVSSKAASSHYRKLLVVDATTGQNALRQAEAFSEAVKIDGLILTKYDSSARGGIALAIARESGIPTAFVCDGERYEDIHVFDSDKYLDEFLGLA
ncbi:MAG: signal recognition particle-docking protein FtsY [Clostridia bacterium]